MARIDPVALTRELVQQASVTPDDSGAMDQIQSHLEAMGFTVERKVFSEDGWPDVDNLYARRGQARPNFCFAGHTDVVPIHHPEAWDDEPFAGVVKDDVVFGRGAADMKGAIAAFLAALERFVEERPEHDGSISLLLTGDEEGPGINGTRKALRWLEDKGERIDLCLVGEPTSSDVVADTIKVGRRGSLHGVLRVVGREGHVAYPHLADNPIPGLLRLLDALLVAPLDDGNEHFQPSNLEVLDLHVGNDADNLVPGSARGRFNVRFNSEHTGASLKALLTERLEAVGVDYEIEWRVSGESFLTPPGFLVEAVADAVEAVRSRRPQLSTTGGTSDARFLKDHCAVVELGLVGATMHRANEQAPVADVLALADVYTEVLRRVFDGWTG
jgi:succinyl-diaminopimelate desuccinylase